MMIILLEVEKRLHRDSSSSASHRKKVSSLNQLSVSREYRCRIDIHLSYRSKEHFSNAFSFWKLDSELIDQRKHRLWWCQPVISLNKDSFTNTSCSTVKRSMSAIQFKRSSSFCLTSTRCSFLILQSLLFRILYIMNWCTLMSHFFHMYQIISFCMIHDCSSRIEIDYEIIFSDLEDLSRSVFESKLRSKRWVIHKEVLLNIIYSGRTTMNLFSDCRRSSMK